MINNPSQVISSSWFIWIWFSQSVSISCRLTDGPVSERDVMTVRDIRDRYSAYGANHSLGSDFCAVCQFLKGHDSVETGSGRFRHYCFLSLELSRARTFIRPIAIANNNQEFIHLLGRNHPLKSQIYHRDCDCHHRSPRTGKCGVSLTANE